MVDALEYFCPRLVDYIAIVGHTNPSVDSETPLAPQILRRYPVEDHDDFLLPHDTAFFCQPEGCSTIGAKQMSLRDRQSFVFALTEKDSGRRRYGTCLNFYRPFKRKYHPASRRLTEQLSVDSASSAEGSVPAAAGSGLPAKALKSHTLTSLCVVSHHAMFGTFRECLNVLIKVIDACSAACSKQRKGSKRSQYVSASGHCASCHIAHIDFLLICY